MKGAALTRWLFLGYCWLGMMPGWFEVVRLDAESSRPAYLPRPVLFSLIN